MFSFDGIKRKYNLLELGSTDWKTYYLSLCNLLCQAFCLTFENKSTEKNSAALLLLREDIVMITLDGERSS